MGTSPPRVLTTMLLPSASCTSIESTRRSSHGRAVNAYGFEVSAPTGHKSGVRRWHCGSIKFCKLVLDSEIGWGGGEIERVKRTNDVARELGAEHLLHVCTNLHLATTTSCANLVHASNLTAKAEALQMGG